MARGALSPCHYNKLHHISLLRVHISQLETELSRAKEDSSRALESTEEVSSSATQTWRETQPLRGCAPGTSSSVCIKTECSIHSRPTANTELADRFIGKNILSGPINRSLHPPGIQATSNQEKNHYLISSIWLEAEKVPGIHIEWVNKTFWEMRVRGRWLAKQGLEVSAIMGNTCPTLYPYPHSREDDAANFWTVSRWAARFVDNFPNISHADRLACWVVIFVTFQVWLPSWCKLSYRFVLTVLQWQICPTVETYRTIPNWYRPQDFQRSMPHMACLDILIW